MDAMIAEPLTPIDVSTMTRDRAETLWQRIAGQDICFDDLSRNNGPLFAARLMAPNSLWFEYKDSGVVSLENILPGISAHAHFFIWDPHLSESEIAEVGRDVCRRAFQNLNLHRLTALPPVMNKLALRVATRIGFRYEGTIREAFLYKGHFLDVHLYGMLRKDFERGR